MDTWRIDRVFLKRYEIHSWSHENRSAPCRCKAYDRHCQRFVHLDIVEKSSHRITPLRHEYDALKRLDHPYIVKAYDFFEDSMGAVFSTEWVAGSSLKEVIYRNPPLGIDRAVGIITSLATALNYACGNARSHGALRPRNIMLPHCALASSETEIKLRGFHRNPSPPPDKPITGPKHVNYQFYLAPELFRNGQPTVRSDIYAFGIIAYEILCHRRPFDDFRHMYDFILACKDLPRIDSTEEIPEWLCELTSRCTKANPRHRLASWRDVLRFIEQRGDVSRPNVIESAFNHLRSRAAKCLELRLTRWHYARRNKRLAVGRENPERPGGNHGVR